MTSRRAFLFGAAASLIAAPAVIRIPGLLMPVKTILPAWTPISRLDMKIDGEWIEIATRMASEGRSHLEFRALVPVLDKKVREVLLIGGGSATRREVSLVPERGIFVSQVPRWSKVA